MKKGPKPKPIEDRFWPKVKKTNKCWIWIGGKTSFGHGIFYYKQRHGLAHRCSYELHISKIPSGLLVCHHCDNPSCVNPTHLFLGTHRDNLQDASRKGRLKRPNHWQKGKYHPCYGRLVSQEERDITAAKQAKNYYITTPTGKQIKITNLKRFAISNGLNVGHLSMLRRNICKSCHGYTNLRYA